MTPSISTPLPPPPFFLYILHFSLSSLNSEYLMTAEIVGPYWELRHEDGALEGIPLKADYSGD